MKTNKSNTTMKAYTKKQIIEEAVRMGCNKTEATRRIGKTYGYYQMNPEKYSLKSAARYCMYIAPCN